MNSRRKAREAILQALYQCDTLEDFSPSAVSVYFESFQSRNTILAERVGGHLEFALAVAQGVGSCLVQLDREIGSASTNWSVGRMPRVDRNILRMAIYEMIYCPDIPVNVTINEAIEISKLYGSADSPLFINGVLDRVSRQLATSAPDPQPILVANSTTTTFQRRR